MTDSDQDGERDAAHKGVILVTALSEGFVHYENEIQFQYGSHRVRFIFSIINATQSQLLRGSR